MTCACARVVRPGAGTPPVVSLPLAVTARVYRHGPDVHESKPDTISLTQASARRNSRQKSGCAFESLGPFLARTWPLISENLNNGKIAKHFYQNSTSLRDDQFFLF